MKIETLNLYNFRCFEEFKISLNKDLNVFVGINGSGKTAILDAIALALSPILTYLPDLKGMDFKDTDFQVIKEKDLFGSNTFKKAPFIGYQIKSNNNLKWDKYKNSSIASDVELLVDLKKNRSGIKQLQDYIKGIIEKEIKNIEFNLPIFVYYGTNRAVLDIPYSRKGFSKTYNRFHALKNCLEGRNRFRSSFNIFYILQQKEREKQSILKSFEYELPELKAIRKAIVTMIPEFSNPRISVSPIRFFVTQKRWDSEVELELEQLSDGYKNLLALVMDLAIRMVEANPHLENPLEAEAIALIDEIELHLHPSWQIRVIQDLQKTFPKTQFILTTHSPQILYNIKKENIFVLDNFQVNKENPFAYGREVNSILWDFFDTPYRLEDIKEEIDKIYTLVDDNKKAEAMESLNSLKEKIGDNDPEIQKLMGYIDFLE